MCPMLWFDINAEEPFPDRGLASFFRNLTECISGLSIAGKASIRVQLRVGLMKQYFLFLLASTIITALLHWLCDIGIGWSALLAFLGWPILGTIVTADDDLPGGWSNPDGTRTPDWQIPEFWGGMLGRGAIVCVAFLAQLGLGAPSVAYFVSAGVFSAVMSVYLMRRSRTTTHAS